MTNVILADRKIPAMSNGAIAKVRALEHLVKQLPQVDIETRHVLHGGMYSRSITLPGGMTLTGAHVRVPTILVINGHATVYIGGKSVEICGYQVLPASAGRKQAFVAHEDTEITMLMATQAQTIEDVEAELTDEAEGLMSRTDAARNVITITGE